MMEKRIWDWLKIRIAYLVSIPFFLYHDVPLLASVAFAFAINLAWIFLLVVFESWADDDDDDDGGFTERVPDYLLGVIR